VVDVVVMVDGDDDVDVDAFSSSKLQIMLVRISSVVRMRDSIARWYTSRR
jgi:hypothetical protein